MVGKKDLLKSVSEQARIEAETQNLDEQTSKDLVEDMVSEATGIIDDLFMSITWEKVEGGVIKSIDPITNWRHRNADDREKDWRYMHFSRVGLQNAAERYLKRPLLHCRQFDWLIVNTLIYAECQATFDFIRSRNMPFYRGMSHGMYGNKFFEQISAGLWRSIVFLVIGLIWLGLFAATFRSAPVASVALTGIVVLLLWRIWKAQKKNNDVMRAMFTTYANLSTVSQSWQVVWDELKKSRDAGAVWDGIVYMLVEERIRS